MKLCGVLQNKLNIILIALGIFIGLVSFIKPLDWLSISSLLLVSFILYYFYKSWNYPKHILVIFLSTLLLFFIFLPSEGLTSELTVHYGTMVENNWIPPFHTDKDTSQVPNAYIILTFLKNILDIPFLFTFKIFRIFAGGLSTYIVYLISKRVTKNNDIAIGSSFIFAFHYFNWWYLAGDQFKNLLGQMFYLGLIYFLFQDKTQRVWDYKRSLMIGLTILLSILSHKLYLFLIPITIFIYFLTKSNIFKFIKNSKIIIVVCLSLFSFLIVLFLESKYHFLNINFLSGYLAYSEGKYASFTLIKEIINPGNLLALLIGLGTIIYYLKSKFRDLNSNLNLRFIFLMFVFLFILSKAYLFGVYLDPFRFAILYPSFLAILLSILFFDLSEKYSFSKTFKYILAIGYILFNIAFVAISSYIGTDNEASQAGILKIPYYLIFDSSSFYGSQYLLVYIILLVFFSFLFIKFFPFNYNYRKMSLLFFISSFSCYLNINPLFKIPFVIFIVYYIFFYSVRNIKLLQSYIHTPINFIIISLSQFLLVMCLSLMIFSVSYSFLAVFIYYFIINIIFTKNATTKNLSSNVSPQRAKIPE